MSPEPSKSAPPDRPLPLGSLASLGSALADRPYARRGVAASGETIRVLLVDDHTVVRQGLHALLHGAPDLVVVGEADSGPAAVRLVAQVAPDVVVMDLDMPGGDGATATREIAGMPNPPKVLILTMHAEDEYLIQLIEDGARGFLTKEAADRELVDAIRVVAGGDVYVRPAVARLLAARLSPSHHRTPADEMRDQFATLSDRERTVLRLIAAGYNGPEVGQRLGITAKTVDTYKQRIEEKIGLAHRTDYVRFAASIGLLEGTESNGQHGHSAHG
jgi:two-component system, NarL family, response regulator NreC